ncbi:hypothetical protein D210916BOD24_13550 [Alteromonas sp. D210916BOD_24]|uniref:hypothetical protein n=1 Tax=Alteromonas sp. D210916BOD_24 TaxID=3157618 RepID=UPI00399D5069
MKYILKYSLLYFGIVFSFGFVFGAIRVLFVVPYIGETQAEIAEAPIMILVSFLTSRFIVRLAVGKLTSVKFIVVGVLALFYLLAIELSLVVWLRELTLTAYIESKYSLAGFTYVVSLLLYTLFPYCVHKSTVKP